VLGFQTRIINIRETSGG